MNKDDEDDVTMRDNYTREDMGPLVRGKYFERYNKEVNTVTVHYADGTSKTRTLKKTSPVPLQKRVDDSQ